MKPSFKRIKVTEVELSREEEPGPIPPGYDELRVLVRQAGTPLGYVKLTPANPDFHKAELRTQKPELRSQNSELAQPEWSLTSTQNSELKTCPAGVICDQNSKLISVAVCTRNRAAWLRGTLEALAVQTYPNFEILIIDNAPDDNTTRELVEELRGQNSEGRTQRAELRGQNSEGKEVTLHHSPLATSSNSLSFRGEIRYIVEPQPGLDWARNRAIAEARGEILAYTDDDARPEANWLEEIARALADPEIDALTGLVIPAELETPAQVTFEDLYGGFGKGFERKLYHRSRPTRRAFPYAAGRYGAGCNMAFRRQIFEEIGGFDLALDVGTPTGGGGDLDMFIRVLRGGFTLLYEPRVVVKHLHRRDMSALQRQMAGYARAFFAYLGKWAVIDRHRAIDILGYLAYSWFSWMFMKAVLALLGRNGVPKEVALAQFFNAPLGFFAYWLTRWKIRRRQKRQW